MSFTNQFLQCESGTWNDCLFSHFSIELVRDRLQILHNGILLAFFDSFLEPHSQNGSVPFSIQVFRPSCLVTVPGFSVTCCVRKSSWTALWWKEEEEKLTTGIQEWARTIAIVSQPFQTVFHIWKFLTLIPLRSNQIQVDCSIKFIDPGTITPHDLLIYECGHMSRGGSIDWVRCMWWLTSIFSNYSIINHLSCFSRKPQQVFYADSIPCNLKISHTTSPKFIGWHK